MTKSKNGFLNRLRAANVERQVAWDPEKKLDASYKANEMQEEAGEAGGVVKKLERERLGLPGSRKTVQDLADELGDVIITADLVANHYGIDLQKAATDKFNKTSRDMGFSVLLEEDDENSGGD